MTLPPAKASKGPHRRSTAKLRGEARRHQCFTREAEGQGAAPGELPRGKPLGLEVFWVRSNS